MKIYIVISQHNTYKEVSLFIHLCGDQYPRSLFCKEICQHCFVFNFPIYYSHCRKDLDLSLSVRFSALPNNCKLELIKLPSARQEKDVTIALQVIHCQIAFFLRFCSVHCVDIYSILFFMLFNHREKKFFRYYLSSVVCMYACMYVFVITATPFNLERSNIDITFLL